MRLACIVCLISVLAASLATPGLAATPLRVILEGPDNRIVRIVQPRLLDTIVQTLCSEQQVASLRGRAHFPIAIVWSRSLRWEGRFYPSFDEQPAAVDIPDWRLYTSDGRVLRCDRRVVGAESLKILLPDQRATAPVVIAVIESGGMNVLHSDYRLARGQALRLPEAMPPSVRVQLPTEGSFDERMNQLRAGPLANMETGILYRLAGTRIIGVYATGEFGTNTDITTDRFHATGTTSAAIGLEHGTNPNALLVFVPDASRAAWSWLVRQKWIDIISTSYYSFSIGSNLQDTCTAAQAIRRIADQGRLVFSAIGNGEQAGVAFTPSGVPESYQVGGVDEMGRSYRPRMDNPFTPTRPYETGDRFEFPAASSDALTGSMDFGGTSGATPSTAGRAAELISFSRFLLGSQQGLSKGALAVAGPGGTVPKQGPLRDGELRREELMDLMHHTATPAEPQSPVRYLIEGYGAFQQEEVELAKRVLSGDAPSSERPEEDRMHELVESARSALFPPARCG